MKTVAVLGGGPAGSSAAERLARGGLKTILFDEKLAWEKPCGGGITYKAYDQYPYLLDNDRPKKLVHETVIGAPGTGEASMRLTHPLVIYSRLELNRLLLERAANAGAAIEKTRVMRIEQRNDHWTLKTRNGTAEADFLIVATGARNPLREVGTQWTRGDTMTALGYYVPARQDRIDIQFLPKLQGYLWVFPRCGHLSVGICGKGEPARALRTRLEAYMDERSIPRESATFYSHVLPSLSAGGWNRNRVAGERWLAVGDAGGLVDPVTGEGLYYAMRSGDLASQVLLDDATAIAAKGGAYRAYLGREFTADLEFAAMLSERVFLGRFLFRTVPQGVVHFLRRSHKFRGVMQDLLSGTQPYLGIRSRLLGGNDSVAELLMRFFFERVLPREAPAVPELWPGIPRS